AEPAAQYEVHEALQEFFRKNTLAGSPHNIKVQIAAGELQVSLHCRLAPTTAITEAHDVTVKLEEFLRTHVSNLGRVVIHVEPAKGQGEG
ncbi:MAG: cation transporter dimerization domain-containing protein, partial [Thermoguttaceae bacterium]